MIGMLLNWNEHLFKEKDKNDRTPLHLVVSAQYEPYVRRYGFRVPDVLFPMKKLATWRVLNANTSAAYQQDINGLYPVHIAALMNRRVAIAILHRKCRGCVGLRDKQGRSFLHIAVQCKNYNVVKYAYPESEFASMMNFRDNDGNTALHLAVEVGDIWIFCSLLRKSEVLLNLRNKKGETPLDLAWSKKNPENLIHRTLKRARAVHGSFWRDRLEQTEIAVRKPKQEDAEKEKEREKEEKKDSDKLTDATQTLGVGSVLIASVTFSATFAVAGAFKTFDNNNRGGTPTLYTGPFILFITANTLAFIYSVGATINLMYSGMPMVKLQIRSMHFRTSLRLAIGSLGLWAVAFVLGVYMVLAPGGHAVEIVVCVTTPIVGINLYARELFPSLLLWRHAYIRKKYV
ncbi:hypothetical protein BRADI_1g53276v3 [Brachypodium distachyon]|uniref:PGG domain-containing protein n=1 Tax=Brachypodium distachyon TaxID=15368 RepID=A0A0Q3K6R1_BRADI|nr:hypothetical protein BRADI_1g53276v3 [Brachypodium distachyon]